MWREGNATGCFRPREPIVIYAPENDPLPTWNIKNHARTWKFRKNEKAGRRWRWQWRLGGEAIVAWTRRRLAPHWPETQRSQSRRWPCRSVSGGRSDCNLVVNWIYGATFQKTKKREEVEGKIEQQFLLCCSSALYLFPTLFPALLSLISSLVQRERQSR